ncbi:Fe2+-enterobactin ABC transporter substrate-binding protein [Chitinimonas arctica]|uniref:Fe2+-enterobactin ABC transporter substrate-binding protein n=1 Tax=Chitinimonas arctica TaxID=2594795 RepID=A0A516SGB4_9NEIS|nr:Fe2+-enterobactin ABC transporter substrate-binding protein [Chitinimonas arctica]QDQ27207.1 Fe2+-enterobactin ABC transporter substrate-binding protein [Chitinimonas arctica]
MTHSLSGPPRRLPAGLACLLVSLSLLTGCDTGPTTAKPPAATAAATPKTAASAQAGQWPRTIASVRGDIVLEQRPLRIVSTSVTLTGTLLTINAPLVASGATKAGTPITDAQGYFSQWADVATARGVKPLYQGEPNAEAIIAANPDLIIMAGTGGDSALKLYEQLNLIAPTLVINYDDKSWQELATILGKATGHEADAAAAIARFAQQAEQTRAKLRLPPQPTTAMVYYEDDSGANVWTAESAQGKLLKDLGFQLAEVPESVKGDRSMGVRRDIIQLSGEKFADGLQGRSLLLFAANEAVAEQLKRNRFLARNPAVTGKQVFAMGRDNFRLDYYSASKLLTRLQQLFPGPA